MYRLIVGLGLSAVIAASATAQSSLTPAYGVKVQAEKGVDFTRFATYTWTQGQPSANKTIDGQIVAAVDRELATLGLTKAASGSGDVLATYYSLSRTDVDLKGKPDAQGVHPQYPVGTLVVALLDPANRKRLLRLRIDTPIGSDSSKLEEDINRAVAAMFAKYPTRQRGR
jgi:hypothetical protein